MFFSCARMAFGQACEVKNEAFTYGEVTSYKVYYNWGFIWVSAGEVTFKVDTGHCLGKKALHLSGDGISYEKYDWVLKVRDRFDSWTDTSSLKPYHYIRNTQEGSRRYYNDCYFDFRKQHAYCITKEPQKPPTLDTVRIQLCTFDPMTMIYYARTIDFSKYKVNDTIPISLFLDNQVYHQYIRYVGREIFEAEGFGKFYCIKFRPLLIEGTIFKGGEGMTVWVTDDKNHLPVYVETPILVGKIKVYLRSYSGMKNPLSSRIK